MPKGTGSKPYVALEKISDPDFTLSDQFRDKIFAMFGHSRPPSAAADWGVGRLEILGE